MANPDRVVIEYPRAADELQSRIGASYYVEPEIIYKTVNMRA
jgi:hypothetical protein